MIEKFILFLVYFFMYNFLNLFISSKNSRNIVGFIHAFLSCLLNLIYMLTWNSLFNQLSLLSTLGYFLYDIIQIIYLDKKDVLRIALIYHHLASIYIILNDYIFLYSYLILFIGELSNLPSYFVYYYIQNDPTSNNLKLWKEIQIILYGFLRIPVMTLALIYLYLHLDFTDQRILSLFYVASPVYLMGLIWTVKLILNKN